MDIQDPNELLKPIATIIIDTAIAASALYTGLGNLLVPNPEGIYVRSRDWPIVTPEMTLFDTKGKRVNYSEIGELNEELRDIDGRTVFSSEIMKNKGMHLRLNGFYSVSAQALVRISIITQLKALCQYTAVPCNGGLARHGVNALCLQPGVPQHLRHHAGRDHAGHDPGAHHAHRAGLLP